MGAKKDIIYLLLIGILVFEIFYQGGYSPAAQSFDDATYLKLATQMLNGSFSATSNPYGYGVLFVATEALGLLLGNPSIPIFLEFLALGAIIYLTLLRYYPRLIAFPIAISCEISGFVLGYSSRILPDMLLGVLIALVFLIYAYKRQDGWWMVVAGFLSGLTLFVKFGGFVLLILLLLAQYGVFAILGGMAVVGFFAWEQKFRGKYRFSFALGLILAICLYQVLVPSQSITSLALGYSAFQSHLSLATLSLNVETFIIISFGYIPPYFYQIFPLGGLFLLAIVGTLLILKRRETKLYFIVVAFWFSILYLYLGTESVTSYTLITVVTRYFIEFASCMAILAGYFINYLYERGGDKIPYIVPVFVLITNLQVYAVLLINLHASYTTGCVTCT